MRTSSLPCRWLPPRRCGRPFAKSRSRSQCARSLRQIALHGPSETDDVRIQKLLIEAGSNINAFGAWNRTPLYEVCSMRKLNNVKLLSRPEININTIDDHHGTPICRALYSTDPRHKDKCVNPQIPLLMVDREDIDVN